MFYKHYKYDEEQMKFVAVKWFWKIVTALGLITLGLLILTGINKIDNRITEAKILVVLTQQNQFESKKLIKKIKELNFQFPYIVYAQAMLETNNFKSPIFLENNNLFGMKESTFRISTALGTQDNHAFYNNWEDSVYDYGYYQATYLSRLKTEGDYFDYLGQYYAADSAYVLKIKNIILRENLIKIFE